MTTDTGTITGSHVAEACGLSQQTVSNVLGGRKAHLYRPETRELILETARRLGYRPNTAARSMRTQRFNAVGLVHAADASRGGMHANQLWAIEEELVARNLHLSMGQVRDERLTDDEALPRLLREWAVDGLLVSYTVQHPQAMVDLIARYRIPSIWLNVKKEVDCVHPDDYGGAAEATRQLLRLGHRDIAFVRHHRGLHYSVVDRWAGYAAAMTAAGAAPRPLIPDFASFCWEQAHARMGMEYINAWLLASDRPTAVVIDDDQLLPLVVHLAIVNGIRIPEDLSVVVLSQVPALVLGRQVTRAAIPTGEIGHEAVPLLLRKVDAPGEPFPAVAVPYVFCPGETMAAPPSHRR